MAQVILLEKIQALGSLGQQVSVRNGYARNYLIPYGKAVPANKKTIAQFESKRAELEALAQEKLTAAQNRADALSKLVLTLSVKAGEEGRLYGSVGRSALIHAVNAAGLTLEKKEIQLPHGSLRQLGEHNITVQLHSDVTVILKINIVPEE